MARNPLAVLVPLAGGLGLIALYDPGFFALFLPYMPGALLVALWGPSSCSSLATSLRITCAARACARSRSSPGRRRSAAPTSRICVSRRSSRCRSSRAAALAGRRFAGWIFVVRALRLDTRRLAAVAGLILNVPNTMLAANYSLAALMGD